MKDFLMNLLRSLKKQIKMNQHLLLHGLDQFPLQDYKPTFKFAQFCQNKWFLEILEAKDGKKRCDF
ncbi:hypothetical protein Hanom_Chr13g01240761 [Helianthus anomalus]